jgi:hypothetical protein
MITLQSSTLEQHCEAAIALTRRSNAIATYYSALSHVSDKPFVIAIAAFDRPLAHFAASRPVLAALYGLYHDGQVRLHATQPE